MFILRGPVSPILVTGRAVVAIFPRPRRTSGCAADVRVHGISGMRATSRPHTRAAVNGRREKIKNKIEMHFLLSTRSE